jgi:hypothetical protein
VYRLPWFFIFTNHCSSWVDGSQVTSGSYIKCCREDSAPELFGTDRNPNACTYGNSSPDSYPAANCNACAYGNSGPDSYPAAHCNPGPDSYSGTDNYPCTNTTTGIGPRTYRRP